MARKSSEGYITMNEMAEQTGIARPTLYYHITRGRLKTRKVGYYTVITEKDANDFKSRLRRVTLGGRDVVVYSE